MATTRTTSGTTPPSTSTRTASSSRPSTRSAVSTRRASSRPLKSRSAAGLNEDLYMNFAGTSEDGKKAVIQAYVFPLVSLDLGRLLGGGIRHHHLPDPEQGEAALRAHPSGRRSRNNMRRLRSSVLLLMLAAVCLSQTPMQVQTPGVRRVGDRLACKCGTCNNTVGNCPMLECHYSHPARQRIAKMLDQGMSDDAIVAVFVKRTGPVGARRSARRRLQSAGLADAVHRPGASASASSGCTSNDSANRLRRWLPPLEPAVDQRYRERIEKEMSDE